MNINHTNEPCNRKNCDVYCMIDDLSIYAKDLAFFAANIALRTARGEAPASAVNAIKTAVAVMNRSQKLSQQLKDLADNYESFEEHATKFGLYDGMDLDNFQDLLKVISELTGTSPEELLESLMGSKKESGDQIDEAIVLGIDPTTGEIKKFGKGDSLPSEIASILNSKHEASSISDVLGSAADQVSLDKEINDFLKS